MKIIRLLSAILFALPLLIFGINYFFHFFSLPPGGSSAGETLLQMMRYGGLMSGIALSHIVIGILLFCLVPEHSVHLYNYRYRKAFTLTLS